MFHLWFILKIENTLIFLSPQQKKKKKKGLKIF